MKKHSIFASILAAGCCLALLIWLVGHGGARPAETTQAPAATPAPRLHEALLAHLDTRRKMVVLLADEQLPDAARARAVAQALFHANLDHEQALEEQTLRLVQAQDFAALDEVLAFIESAPELYDADRLAFVDLLNAIRDGLQGAQTLNAIKLHKRVSDDLDSLAEVEKLYEKELGPLAGLAESRSMTLKRQRWDDYLAMLKTRYVRERIIAESGIDVEPLPASERGKSAGQGAEAEPGEATPATERGGSSAREKDEVFGNALPPKTVALTFDDGPHRKYTDEIVAVLKQYGAPAVFFQVGKNLGAVDASGKAKLSTNATVDFRLLDGGYVLANHSYSHAQLSKLHDRALADEVANTDKLLKAVSTQRSNLFRFPYGARNKEGLQLLSSLKLTSVMWTIDSEDWADPVPASIANRVLQQVAREKKGIILFHDIHGQSVKALPLILERLQAEGYRFAGWNGEQFSVPSREANVPVAPRVAPVDSYQNSWAVVIGVNDYEKWPKLQYAAMDAMAVKKTLVEKLGFPADHVVTLMDKDATRVNILSAFTSKPLADVGQNDRVFIFFAGHGTTRQLSSGRQLGYIVPYDAEPAQTASQAIAMTDLQNVAESLQARHVFFAMDACYSGLGLVRGGADRFLADNSRRLGRQMLTAGGADQLVADGGPGGHSVFTWTLLQALDGKADLNEDGVITATEIAAYVAPAVSKISAQTPAFGSLPGSEGGEFVFAVPRQGEGLTASTVQLPADAIAMNSKLAEAAAPASGDRPVVLKNLEGKTATVAPATSTATSTQQRAAAANLRGEQAYRERHYDVAITAFREAVELQPDNAAAANNLGFVLYKQGKLQDAIEWLERTLKMDPSRSVAYLNLADALDASNQREKAKKAYETYLALAPAGGSAERVRQRIKDW